MTATELTRALETGEIKNEGFHHFSHLHVAWVYLSGSSSLEEAAAKISETLRRFAAAAGKAEKYHETITQFWMRLLAYFRDSAPDRELTSILQTNPELLEKDLPLQYYSRETLFSDRARKEWVEPDLKPLPTDATAFHPSGSARDSSNWVVCR